MKVQTYLQFDGHCAEALEFYKQALGAEINAMMRFKDAPDQSQVSPEAKDKVMHACFKLGNTEIMASDGFCKGKPSFEGFSLTLLAPSRAEAERLLQAVSQGGGEVQMPVTETFFSTGFGVGKDRFGVNWMVVAPSKEELAAA
jgi:PhnB protein